MSGYPILAYANWLPHSPLRGRFTILDSQRRSPCRFATPINEKENRMHITSFKALEVR